MLFVSDNALYLFIRDSTVSMVTSCVWFSLPTLTGTSTPSTSTCSLSAFAAHLHSICKEMQICLGFLAVFRWDFSFKV